MTREQHVHIFYIISFFVFISCLIDLFDIYILIMLGNTLL